MDKKEKNKETNKKILGAFCAIVIIIFILVMFTGGNNTHENTTEKMHINIKELDFDRYGYLFDRNLYGTITGIDTNGTNHTYYMTKDQMAGLYYHNNDFQYPELLITYHIRNNDTYIIDHIYTTNGEEIKPVTGQESDEFAAHSVQLAKGKQYCNPEFGMTVEETI